MFILIYLYLFIYLIFDVTYFFLNTVHACVCIYIYLINIHSTHTHILCKQKRLFWMRFIAINCLNAVVFTQPIKCFGSVSLYFYVSLN